MNFKTLFLLFLLCASNIPVFSQVLSSNIKKGVVLFETPIDSSKFQPIGTGFILVYRNITFCVTNKHISNQENLYIRFNIKTQKDSSYSLPVNHIKSKGLDWLVSGLFDISIIGVVLPDSIKSEELDLKSIGISFTKPWDYINEGDEVYVLGFPMGYGADIHYSPVSKFGIIALKQKPGEFLLDINTFPGNSGGPIFLKPEIYDYRTSKLGEVTKPYLIGIISSYIPYIDTCISNRTKRARITFEENSGLAIAISSEQIIALAEIYIKNYNLNTE